MKKLGETFCLLIVDKLFDVAGVLNIIPFSRVPPRIIPQPEEEEMDGELEMGDVKLEDVETNGEIGEITDPAETEENSEEVKVETEEETPAAPKFMTTSYKKHESPCRLFMFYAIVITELAQMTFVVGRFMQNFARSPVLNSETVIQGLYMEFHIASGIFGLNLILYQDELVRLLNQIQELIVHFKGRKMFSNFLIKFSLKII